MKQKDLILKYMNDFGSITDREAVIDLGIGRLASRICDLRKDGYDIISETAKAKNRYGKIVHFARYRINDKAGA